MYNTLEQLKDMHMEIIAYQMVNQNRLEEAYDYIQHSRYTHVTNTNTHTHMHIHTHTLLRIQ